MILIICSNKIMHSILNKSAIQIDRNLWIGDLTIREQDKLKELINYEKNEGIKIFTISKEDFKFYANKTLDFMFDL